MTLENLDTVVAFAVIMLLLSLVITTLVQIVVAITGLRGSNLLRGVKTLLEQSPELKTHAMTIAQKALSHPAVAPIQGRFKRYATAVGSLELVRILQDLAKDSNTSLDKEAKAGLQKAVSQLESHVAAWFDMIMARTTDLFVLRTRWITIASAALLAFGLHIDSLVLLKDLSTAAEARAALAQSAGQVGAQAQTILEQRPIATEALRAIQGAAPELAGAQIPPNLITLAQGESWLRERLGQSTQLSQRVEAYARSFEEQSIKALGERLGPQLSGLWQELDRSRLEIVPSPFPFRWDYWNQKRHLVGVSLTALLLSLGAPFWFNMLRKLANLRPMLAGKVDPSKSGAA